jgi:short-subunit dehydrogenase
MKNKLIIFGASSSIAINFVKDPEVRKNFDILGIVRKKNKKMKFYKNILEWDVLSDDIPNKVKNKILDFNAKSVLFAQGLNLNDNIYNFNHNNLTKILSVNCFYILKVINILLKKKIIKDCIYFLVISSIWQIVTRRNKLSYTISKSALSGLVRSLSIDLKNGHVINSILPGVINNKMTRENLSSEQINQVKKMTPGNKLLSTKELNEIISKFCLIRSMNGQMISVDKNFHHAKIF